MKIFSFIIIFFLSVTQLFPATDASFSGNIKDKNNAKPIPGVTILIEGRAYGAISKRDGSFVIKGLANGKYTALISYIGYKPQKIDFIISPEKKNISIEIELEETVILGSEVIVSANKRVQAVQDVPISVSIIDSKILHERNITSLDDALRYVPGVNINYDHVSIRGSSGFAFGLGSRVQVLLDGFPLIAADNGDIKFDALPMFNIERVEIVKGAGSALYGTGALGGVINIITQDPSDKPEIKLKTYSGIYTNTNHKQWNYTDEARLKSGIDASYAKKFGNFGFLVSGDIQKDDSYRQFDETFKWNAFTKMNYSIGDYTKLILSGNISKNAHDDWVYWNSIDSATSPPTNTDRDNVINSDKFTVAAALTHIFNNGNFLKASSGAYINTLKNHPKNRDEYRESFAVSVNSEIQMNSMISDKIALTYGINHGYNDVDSKIFGIHQQQIFSGYAQTEISSIKNLITTLGARLDYERTDEQEENIEFSPKFGLSYQSEIGINFRASAGKGFRAATVAERFAAVQFSGFTVIANPVIKPEHSWSFELGAMFNVAELGFPVQIDAAIFQNELYDLIEPTFVLNENAYNIQFLNVTRARIQGIELDLKALPMNFLGIETSFTFMQPEDLTLNEILKYRAKFLWYNRIFIPINFVELQADYRYLSKVINIDTRLSLPGGIMDAESRVPGHIVDARIIFHLKKLDIFPLTLSINANNLLNYYYTEVPGNLAPTRHISLIAIIEL